MKATVLAKSSNNLSTFIMICLLQLMKATVLAESSNNLSTFIMICLLQ
jgi:hypothetical protein